MDKIKLTRAGAAIIKASVKTGSPERVKITHNIDKVMDKIIDDIIFTDYYNSTAKNNI